MDRGIRDLTLSQDARGALQEVRPQLPRCNRFFPRMVALWGSEPETGRRSNRCRGGNGQLRCDLDPSRFYFTPRRSQPRTAAAHRGDTDARGPRLAARALPPGSQPRRTTPRRGSPASLRGTSSVRGSSFSFNAATAICALFRQITLAAHFKRVAIRRTNLERNLRFAGSEFSTLGFGTRRRHIG